MKEKLRTDRFVFPLSSQQGLCTALLQEMTADAGDSDVERLDPNAANVGETVYCRRFQSHADVHQFTKT